MAEEVGFGASHRRLEVASEVAQATDFATLAGEFRPSDQVDCQRCREQAVASLPDELQRHLRAEEAFKVDVVPRGFPITHRFDVLDGDKGLRMVSKDVRDQVVFRLQLAELVDRILQHLAVPLPRMLWPTQLATCRFRRANIGARTAFINVSPVLPSRTHVADAGLIGELHQAGCIKPNDGVKLT